MSRLGRGAALAILLLLTGCFFGTKRKSFDYGPYVASDPRSVVVAPIAGLGPTEPVSFLSMLTKPLAERGYYVMPVRMSQQLAAQEGFSAIRRETESWFDMDNNHSGSRVVDNPEDAERIKKMATGLAAFFGADSVLFVQIVDWEHKINHSEGFFSNLVDEKMDFSVGLDYLLADARGQTIWRAKKHIVHTRGGGSIFTEIWNASTKPTDDDISTQLAREVNWWVITGQRLRTPRLTYYDSDPMLVGPYNPSYEPDRARRRRARKP